MSFTCFGSLIALEKSLHAGMDPCAEKDLRPIVSGNIVKRIISKAAIAHITSEIVMHYNLCSLVSALKVVVRLLYMRATT